MERKSGWKGKLHVVMAMIIAVSTPGPQSLVLIPLVLAPLATEADECIILNGTGVPPAPCLNVAIAPKDSDLRQDAATTNSGAATTMHVQAGVGGIARRAIVQFDLTTSGIPTSASIKTSFLRLFKSVAHASGTRFYQARLVTDATAWTEGDVTWNDRTTSTPWTAAGGDFNLSFISSQTITTPATGTVTWTIRSDATVGNIPQGWLTGTVPNNGVVIRDSGDSPGAGIAQTSQFVTQQGATATQRPTYELRFLRDVTLGAPTVGVSEVTWTWTFPGTSANYDGILLLKKAGPAGIFAFAPVDGNTSYTDFMDVLNGETILANTTAFTTVSVTDENGPNSEVLPGITYTYKAITHDSNSIPGAPTLPPPRFAKGVSMDAAIPPSVGGATKNWSYRAGAATLSAPALDPGNVVLTGSPDGLGNNFLHAMNATNGGRKYQPVAGFEGDTVGPVQSRPTVIPAAFSSFNVTFSCGCDMAYVASGDGTVQAFDPATGTKHWPFGSAILGDAIIGSPAVQLYTTFSNSTYQSTHTSDMVIVGTRNLSDNTTNKIYGLNGDTGVTVWTFNPGNMDIITSNPILDYSTNSVWVTSHSGFTPGTQASVWQVSTIDGSFMNSVTLPASSGHIAASPEFDPQGLYLFMVTTTGDLVAIDSANPGNVFITSITGGGGGLGFPIVLAGTGSNVDVYFSTSAGVHKRIFDTATPGFLIFTAPNTNGWDTLNATLGGAPSAPIYTYESTPNNFVYVGANGQIQKLDITDGSVDLTRTVNMSATLGDPSFDTVSRKFYIGDTSGRIYSFDKF